jgi:hypothetical protein
VNAVAYFPVMDAIKAVVEVENYLYAAKLAEAAAIVAKESVAIQLRYLQTLTEIGVEKNPTASSRNNTRRCADPAANGIAFFLSDWRIMPG